MIVSNESVDGVRAEPMRNGAVRLTSNTQQRTGFQELLCSRNNFGKLINGGPKLFLQVANTGKASVADEAWRVGCIQESRVCYSIVSTGRKELLLRRLPMRCCAIVDDNDLREIQAKFVYDFNARGCRVCNIPNAFGLLAVCGVVRKPRQRAPASSFTVAGGPSSQATAAA